MTAAIAHLTRPRLRASLRGRPVHIVTVLALVLPVPFCAALGLTLPLPASVARIAARLVPFANSAVLNAKEEQFLGARGSIVKTPAAPAGNAGRAIDPAGSPAAQQPRKAGEGRVPGGKVEASTTASPIGTATTTVAAEHGSSAPLQTDPSARPTSSSGSGSPTSSSGSASVPDTGSTPPPPPSPPPSSTPTVVDTATAAAATVVGTAANTVTTATSTVAATVAAAPGVVKGAVGIVLRPKP
jgi:hypothetical protein